jgi:citrate synthase
MAQVNTFNAETKRHFNFYYKLLAFSDCVAVSGAHNTIVAARAGKDLMSSLASGLLTIVSTWENRPKDM